jgi:hypothetical protein
MLETARRFPLQDLAREWTNAYPDTRGHILGDAGSARPREDAALLLALPTEC